MRNYLNNLYNATCCTLVSDDFSEDTVDQYSFWGLNPTDELSVAGGKLTVPNGGRLRRNNCIDRVKGIRISVSTATIDRDHSLSIFFWCNSDLTAGYQVRIHNNTGAGEASRKGCLVELCNASGSVLKSRYDGANSSINIVEAWADADSGDAFITINDSFSWKITYLSAVAEDGYFGIGTQSDRDDLEVESYTAVLVGSTGETMGCIGECSHVTPINDCTHTAPCNGGTLDEDYFSALSSVGDCWDTFTDYTADGDGWSPQSVYPCNGCPSMDRWTTAQTSATITITGGGGSDACGDQPFRFCSIGGGDFDAQVLRRFVNVSACSNTIKLKISMTKSSTASITASINLYPVCGTALGDSLSASWPQTATAPPLDCDSSESDEVEKEIQNIPVGIYAIVVGASPLSTAFAGSPFSVTLSVEGVGRYERNCTEAQSKRAERDDKRDELDELIATNVGGVNDAAIATLQGEIDDLTADILGLGGTN